MKKLGTIFGSFVLVACFGCSQGAGGDVSARPATKVDTASKAGETSQQTYMRVKHQFGTAPTIGPGTSTTTHGIPK